VSEASFFFAGYVILASVHYVFVMRALGQIRAELIELRRQGSGA